MLGVTWLWYGSESKGLRVVGCIDFCRGSLYAGCVREHLYYCYIVASRSHALYVGMTGGIELRMLQHKNGVFDGFSKTYRCNRLVWFERFAFVERAIAREKQLKGWSRAKKIALIERENPAWVDLSEEWGRPVKMFGE